jgi:hypothetical protein
MSVHPSGAVIFADTPLANVTFAIKTSPLIASTGLSIESSEYETFVENAVDEEPVTMLASAADENVRNATIKTETPLTWIRCIGKYAARE